MWIFTVSYAFSSGEYSGWDKNAKDRFYISMETADYCSISIRTNNIGSILNKTKCSGHETGIA